MVERFYSRTAVKGLHVIVSIVSVSEREKERANKGGNKRAIESNGEGGGDGGGGSC